MIGCGENIGKPYLCVHWEGTEREGGGVISTKLPFQQWAPPSSTVSARLKFSSHGSGALLCPTSSLPTAFSLTEQWQHNFRVSQTHQKHYCLFCLRSWQFSSTCMDHKPQLKEYFSVLTTFNIWVKCGFSGNFKCHWAVVKSAWELPLTHPYTLTVRSWGEDNTVMSRHERLSCMWPPCHLRVRPMILMFFFHSPVTAGFGKVCCGNGKERGSPKGCCDVIPWDHLWPYRVV